MKKVSNLVYEKHISNSSN